MKNSLPKMISLPLLESYQNKQLSKTFFSNKTNFYDIEEKGNECFGVDRDYKRKKDFYNGYIKSFNKNSITDMLKDEESEDFENRHYFINPKNVDSRKKMKMLNKKRNSPNNIPMANMKMIKAPFEKIKFEVKHPENTNTNTTVNKTEKNKKEEESKKTPTAPELTIKSTELTNLNTNQITKHNKNNQNLFILPVVNKIIIDHLSKAQEQYKGKNLSDDELINNLKLSFPKKTWYDILKIPTQKENIEVNKLLEKTPWDYLNELLSKKFSYSQKKDSKRILKFYDFIKALIELKEKFEKKKSGIKENKNFDMINKNKNDNVEEIANQLNHFNLELKQNDKNNIIIQQLKCKENDKIQENSETIIISCEEDIEKENKEGNLLKIIKTWILNSFIKEFNQISTIYKLHKVKKSERENANNNNNNNKKDLEFFNSNFESFYAECKKENKNQIYENIEENENINNLKTMNKLKYFNQLKSGKKFSDLTNDKANQIKKYKKNKCRIKLYELFQSNDIEVLILLMDKIYIDKKKKGNYIKIEHFEAFQKNINNLRGYETFSLDLSKKEEKNIDERIEKLDKIASDPIGYLEKRKEEINERQ